METLIYIGAIFSAMLACAWLADVNDKEENND